MKKIFYFFIVVLLLIVVFLCIHFYQRTNGFEKSYTNIIVSLNNKEIEKISTNQELIIGKSYEFEIKDTLITSKKIPFEYEIIPISNLKYQVDRNYYTWNSLYDKEEYQKNGNKNLNRFFKLLDKDNSFVLKPTKTEIEIIECLCDVSTEKINFSEDKKEDLFLMNLKVDNELYTYSFNLKKIEQEIYI